MSSKKSMLLAVCGIIFLVLSSILVIRGSSNLEIEATAVVHKVIDGVAFDTSPIGKVRLADIDTSPNEPEYSEAANFLGSLVNNKKVYLDLDDKNRTDSQNRTVCLVYVRHNSTHLKNVNKALLEKGLAKIKNYDNEFDPETWTLYVHYTQESEELNYWDYRQIYLTFLSQELVAHGTMLFAASTSSFIFITGLINKNKKNRFLANWIFVLISGILLGLTVFLGFRVLYYGALTHATTNFIPELPTKVPSYGNYTDSVAIFTQKSAPAIGDPLFKTLRRGTFPKSVFDILPVSLYIGLALAYFIFYAFGEHSINKSACKPTILTVCFGWAAVIGILGIFNNFGAYVNEPSMRACARAWECVFLFFLLLSYFGSLICLQEGAVRDKITVSRCFQVIFCIIFGILVMVFEDLVKSIVGLFLIIQGILLLANYLELRRK